MSDIESHQQPNKSHHKKQKGAKAKKKDHRKNFETVNEESGDKKNESFETEDDYRKARARNPRAFALQSFVAAERQFRRTQDIKAKRIQMPEVDRASLEPPPIFVAIVGPPRVGKSILMQSLVKNYTRQKLNNIKGPVTVVGGKKRRITFYECNNDLNSMIDAAKVADLVLLMIDSSFGFEMETFEFLNICQVHGFPRIMGVLTHMDMIKNPKALKKTKKKLKHRFWTEIYQGAKLFYLTGLVNGEYRRNEIHNLARFISVMKFKDIGYRLNHSFIVCDRLEDLTQPDLIRQNEKCDRNVCLYGYVRGSGLKNKSNVHIPGVGDFQLNDVSFLSDPCPLPDKEKKRTLDDRERLIYAPFSGVGGLIYDKDAVYIELGGSHSHMIDNTYSSNNPLLNQVISSKNTVDSKLTSAKLKMFSDAPDIDSYLEDEQIEANDSGKEESEGDFESSDDQSEDEVEDEEEEEEEEDEEEEDEMEESEMDEKEEDEEEDEETWGSLKWKENLKEKANIAYSMNKTNRTNWSKVIYGNQRNDEENQSVPNDDDADDDNLFKIKKINLNDYSEKIDNSKYNTSFNKWTEEKTNNDEEQSEAAFDSIRDCFVTGKWDKNSDAAHLLAGDDDDEVDENDFDDDDEMFGDFEDMETGENFHQSEAQSDSQNDDEQNKNERKKTKSEMSKRERLIEKKKRLKEQFDREFDESKSGDKTGESAYYDALKEEATDQTNLNRLEFEKLDDMQRIEFEGFRVGMYVRIEINSMPCEFVKNFDARYLAIVGCLESNEANIGYVQVRLKKHRWHNKILKTNDPLVISLGWRRFQTLPVYFVQDHNMRNRSLKYTPEHMHCHASFWGPITPQGTGFLAIQTMSSQNKNFRISATGVVVETNKATQIVKKLKLIGTPLKIFRKTAFVQGMFSTVIEASKFEGASIKTVSGIRGQIKKALHSSSVPAGSVRATFEDRIMASDSIFLRSWFAIEVPKFYAPITNLLAVKHEQEWLGVKTLGILKKEKSVQINPDENSLYKKIEREEKVFAPLKIKRKLQEKLPFSLKTKTGAVQIDPLEKQRVAIVREPEEQKMASVMKMFKKVYEHRVKAKQEHQTQMIKKHKKEEEKRDLKRLQKSKELKKQIYRRLGKKENRKNKFDE